MKNFSLFICLLFISGSAFAAEGDLEPAIEGVIESFKSGGGVIAIVIAFVALLRTNLVMKYLSPLLQKIGFSWILYQPIPKVLQPEPPKPEVILTGDVEGVNPGVMMTKLPEPQIKGTALPWVTLATGLAAGIGQGLASGNSVKSSVVQGVFSSGAAMTLFDLILKPLFKKKS